MTNQSVESRVTLGDLEVILHKYPRLDSNPFMDAHLLALIATGKIMGRIWCQKWFFPFSRENKNRPGNYFYPSKNQDDPLDVLRQIRFAELLFNLQGLDGFNERTKEWQGHSPEAIVAELESLFYMMSCGHRPSLVSPAQCSDRRRDFDVVLRWGQKAAWEVKSKLETVEFDAAKLINVLQDARRQLPKDMSNVVFVRIPERWTFQSDFKSRIEEPVDHLFRNSPDRAFSVLLHWELWESPYSRSDRQGVAGIEIVNLRWDILAGGRRVIDSYQGFPQGWVRFEVFCARGKLVTSH